MSNYHQFNQGDILWSSVFARPRVNFASGSSGWRSNTGVSSSISLYGGVRERADVGPGSVSGLSLYQVPSSDSYLGARASFSSGSYPFTGSVHFVKARSTEAPSLSSITSDNWYNEHFNVIGRLYDFYGARFPSYSTASFDYTCMFFYQNVQNSGSCVQFLSSNLTNVSSTFTTEAWIKPVSTGSTQTIMAQRDRWKLFLSSSGEIVFTDSTASLSSNTRVSPGQWTHVCVAAGAGTASFYVNGQLDVDRVYSGSIPLYKSVSGSLSIGAVLSSSAPTVAADTRDGFTGYIFETRVWSTRRTSAQVSSSWSRSLFSSGSESGLVHYARFNDGPFGSAHGYSMGSGAFDYAAGVAGHGRMANFNIGSSSPTWQPNDNLTFIPKIQTVDAAVGSFRVLHVPSLFYGRQIATGSVRLTCDAYAKKGIERVIVDDGRGGLYVSGSMTRRISGEDRTGVFWNRVGNVFYSEGLVVLSHPSLQDFGDIDLDATGSLPDTLQVSFSGQTSSTAKIFQCRVAPGEANASNNRTFYSVVSGSTDRRVANDTPPVTWITAVGLYDSQRRLVGVAKLAQPIRKREKDPVLLRIRYDI